MVKSAIELKERLKDPLFKAAYEDMAMLGGKQLETAPVGSPRIGLLPSSQREQRHPDVEFDAAIQRAFDGLREEREAFLLVVHDQLLNDSVLCLHFLASLEELNGGHYRSALDPAASWTRF